MGTQGNNNNNNQNNNGNNISKEQATAYDEKNIRRRVYDALNVLMAMDIISKEKKEITWKGLPSLDSLGNCNLNEHDINKMSVNQLQGQKDQQKKRIYQKREQIRELLVQQV